MSSLTPYCLSYGQGVEREGVCVRERKRKRERERERDQWQLLDLHKYNIIIIPSYDFLDVATS